jgi:AcrR family transcriptional regulator
MARIDLARRAQIGRARSARTRAELITAARGLYAARPFDRVTVDDVVAAADVAKGTFYVHFDSLADLQSIVADDLARELDELLQPRRLAIDDPIERIAAGCGAFIMQTLRDPAWGALVARSAAAMPHVAGVARKRLKEDIDRAARDGHLGGVTPELAFDFATGIMLHMMLSAPQRQRSPQQASAIVAGLLRAIGAAPDKAATVAQRAIEREQAQSPTETRIENESKDNGGQSGAFRVRNRPTLGRGARY